MDLLVDLHELTERAVVDEGLIRAKETVPLVPTELRLVSANVGLREPKGRNPDDLRQLGVGRRSISAKETIGSIDVCAIGVRSIVADMALCFMFPPSSS